MYVLAKIDVETAESEPEAQIYNMNDIRIPSFRPNSRGSAIARGSSHWTDEPRPCARNAYLHILKFYLHPTTAWTDSRPLCHDAQLWVCFFSDWLGHRLIHSDALVSHQIHWMIPENTVFLIKCTAFFMGPPAQIWSFILEASRKAKLRRGNQRIGEHGHARNTATHEAHFWFSTACIKTRCRGDGRLRWNQRNPIGQC